MYLQFYSRKRPIEQFLETEISDLKSGLTEGDRLFLHDYLLGHLQGRSALGSLLYGYFTDIEEFLRAAHKAFAGRAGVSIGDLYRQIGFDPATTKHIPLGHLVEFCARVSVAAGGDRGVTQGWNEWTLIRNRLLHGDWHPEETWSRDLTVLLQQQARLQSIASHIHRLAPQKAALKLKFIKMARPTEPRTKEEGDPASSAAK